MPKVAQSNVYLYFMISAEHVAKRNEIAAKTGCRFECGTVVARGTKKKYSHVATTKEFMKMYPDSVLVAEGYRNVMQYTQAADVPKGGN